MYIEVGTKQFVDIKADGLGHFLVGVITGLCGVMVWTRIVERVQGSFYSVFSSKS